MTKQNQTMEYIDRLENWKGAPAVRADAARKLGMSGDKQAIDPLVKVLNEEGVPNDLRRAVTEALGRLRSAEAIDILIEKGYDESTIAEALKEMEGVPVLSALIRAINDERTATRERAILLLSTLREWERIEHGAVAKSLLERVSNEPDKKLRNEMVGLLGELGNQDAAEIIMRLPQSNETIIALGKLRNKKAVPLLLDILDDRYIFDFETPEKGEDLVFEELSKFERRVWEQREGITQKERQKIEARTFAAQALGNLGDLGAVPDLVEVAKLITNEEEFGKRDALEALGIAAVQALGKIHPAEAASDLLMLLRILTPKAPPRHSWGGFGYGLSPRSMSAVESALCEIAKANNIQGLLVKTLKENSDPRARRFAAKTIGCAKIGEAFDVLLAALDDEPQVASQAVTALIELDASRAKKPIEQALRKWNQDPQFNRETIETANVALRKLSLWTRIFGKH